MRRGVPRARPAPLSEDERHDVWRAVRAGEHVQLVVRRFQGRRSPGAIKKWHKTYRILRSRHVQNFVSSTRLTTPDQRAHGEFNALEVVQSIGYGVKEHEVRRALDDHLRWEREPSEPVADGLPHAAARARRTPSLVSPPVALPPALPPPTLPDAAELHRQHLATALARYGASLPRVPLPDEFVKQCVVQRGAIAQGSTGPRCGPLSLEQFLAKRPEVARARDHSPTHEVWLRTRDWLTERTAYLVALHALAGRIWQDVWAEFERDRAAGSIRPPKTPWPSLDAWLQEALAAPKLPTDVFVLPVLLATYRTLAGLGVARRVIAADPLRPSVDRAGGDGGYVKRERLDLFVVVRPTAPRHDFDFVRDHLPGALSGWSRRAGDLQERWRLELAGAPAVMNRCCQCAVLSQTRQALVATFGALDAADLRDGHCEQCRPAVVASPQG